MVTANSNPAGNHKGKPGQATTGLETLVAAGFDFFAGLGMGLFKMTVSV
jgi:hypothetical protein